ncbi:MULTISPECIES: CaiB/BaiF CoA transferase family protein [Halomonadaceae]|jgi:crotonobetainyl-CoA:carnitine CoA-transferase CaiB-like acyl-CoA transferase|uniref:CaiB/BaiF CoA transferase family protein n=1 Tax=Halomonadaceae TaxID=28256 RepID=UPI0012EF139D|nr:MULTISPECIES: CaiB/BaiF CoA-transferase family protein [Halomonas]CAD5258811.1 Crotonobetainyl-CoA:carnitine CoA-transferase CaiB [Halomonas sp. 59]CAD5259050.1 Crotonobetainyl-CoA:carnitine CoA-transferase CaiB [Halomonas sp. 113]CAD5272974.1 Crotonobetainyl-CoA:carnitine CoA-transferase CaiB [Halomonas sp. I3]CAD5289631.1 Crotonobetainyl-CoA:carnitine CoA-transferase CaiB [Halomonas sp. 156]VXB32406.1 Crotonobetainyl-CoA:carnitine CoA-transferase CaiB [Halomonas titanicae]
MSGPLSHIRVLDLSRIMAGPWAGQILADLGAEVIKVERAGVGDDTRRWGPPFLKSESGEETQESGYYLSVNRGKKSVEVDITSETGQANIRELARTSDILLENFKVGTLERYGLGAEQLHEVNPDLIYCSITGFGQDGPRANDVAYDFMIQAMGGLMSVTGVPDGEPGEGPQKVGVPIVDIMTGMYSVISVLAALANRSQNGGGEQVDIAMLDVATAMLANQAMNHLVSGNTPTRKGNKHPNIQPQDVFPVRDGYLVLAVGNDEQFVRFAKAIGKPELSEDPRYATNAERVNNLDALHPLISERLREKDLADWLTAFQELKVPCGPINTVPMVLDEPQIKHRQMLRYLPHPLAGKVPQVVSPMRFKASPLSFDNAPPLLGEHNDEILKPLGIGKENK